MPVYDIAGLKVNIHNCKGRTLRQAEPYLSENQSENQKIHIDINITPEKIEQAKKDHPEFQGEWEYMLTSAEFYSKLIGYGGILLHSSCVVADGVAYAFSADSGTGKSTHTKLWLKMLGERAYILNDDKPAIRIIDGRVYACGTPWSGKYDCSKPENVPLGAICFLERGSENSIKKAETKKAIYSIFSQTVRKLEPKSMELVFDVLEGIFNSVPIYELTCNMDISAAELSYNAMKRSADEF